MKRLKCLNRHSPWLLAVLKIMTALLLLSAGLVKLVGFPAGAQPGQMPIMSLLGLAAILEVVGGILDPWPVHATRRVRLVRGNGRRLLDGSCAQKLLPDTQIRARRRSSSASSFCIWWQQDPVRGVSIVASSRTIDRNVTIG
jgi:hypothetical protein